MIFSGTTGFAQTPAVENSGDSLSLEKIKEKTKPEEAASEEKELSGQKYRLLQDNGLLVETAYQQEEDELQHAFSLSRTNRRTWTMRFSEEIPLGSEKYQLSIELPAQFVKNEAGFRGAGDTQINVGFMVFGSNASRVTVSPNFGISLPTGSARRETGRGAVGFSAALPVSVMLGKRFASNTKIETTFTPKARNPEGERANLMDFEIGQSFVWFAKPKLNFLIEAVWEREQEVVGAGLKKSEREFYISPGARWAYKVKNFLIVPGIAVPFGLGPSSGERGILFSITFEQATKKEGK